MGPNWKGYLRGTWLHFDQGILFLAIFFSSLSGQSKTKTSWLLILIRGDENLVGFLSQGEYENPQFLAFAKTCRVPVLSRFQVCAIFRFKIMFCMI